MPLYDYKCPDHGLFHDLATMADSARPALADAVARALEKRVDDRWPSALALGAARAVMNREQLPRA